MSTLHKKVEPAATATGRCLSASHGPFPSLLVSSLLFLSFFLGLPEGSPPGVLT